MSALKLASMGSLKNSTYDRLGQAIGRPHWVCGKAEGQVVLSLPIVDAEPHSLEQVHAFADRLVAVGPPASHQPRRGAGGNLKAS